MSYTINLPGGWTGTLEVEHTYLPVFVIPQRHQCIIYVISCNFVWFRCMKCINRMNKTMGLCFNKVLSVPNGKEAKEASPVDSSKRSRSVCCNWLALDATLHIGVDFNFWNLASLMSAVSTMARSVGKAALAPIQLERLKLYIKIPNIDLFKTYWEFKLFNQCWG